MTFTPAISPSSFLMTDGQDVDLFPMPSEVTVAQAAKILDGPELFVNELLDDNRIAYRQENGERFVQLDSLLHYAEEEARSDASFAEMVRWDQEMGLYDD